jgi:hypothetical protein
MADMGSAPAKSRAWFEAVRRMTGDERLRLSFDLSEAQRAAIEGCLRQRFPEFSDADVREAMMHLIHGIIMPQEALMAVDEEHPTGTARPPSDPSFDPRPKGSPRGV